SCLTLSSSCLHFGFQVCSIFIPPNGCEILRAEMPASSIPRGVPVAWAGSEYLLQSGSAETDKALTKVGSLTPNALRWKSVRHQAQAYASVRGSVPALSAPVFASTTIAANDP